ncbi:MAG: hypothetical protein J4F97_01355, partial [Pseudomonadales bacterium]|nr:hypothetical protein [Pseudomonadales bacterium]
MRKFARTEAALELELDRTIRATAENGDCSDIRMQPERQIGARVLVFFDVGGSLVPHVRVCEELFPRSVGRARISSRSATV